MSPQLWTKRIDQSLSTAERILFAALEANGDARGSFQLNHCLDFAFGPRAIEVDLVSMDLSIAIEIDGYFHFTDLDAWRRDRRKDRVLQSQGYFVLRFLADDVLQDLVAVVRVIRETVLRRH